MITVTLGQIYQNRLGEQVKIKAPISSHHIDHRHGFRYVDDLGRIYREDGTYCQDWRQETGFDLIYIVRR